MKERVISGIVIALILAAVVYMGEAAVKVGSIIIAFLALKEIMDIKKDFNAPKIVKALGYITLFLIIVSSFMTEYAETIFYYKIAIVFLLVSIPTMFIKDYKTSDAFYLGFCILFISEIFVLLIDLFIDNSLMLLYVIIVACITDMFALFCGKLIGKHKLTKISPKKTVEGSIGGAIFATIIGVTYYTICFDYNNLFMVILLTVALSVIGQMGDIFFSLIKRENDKKDYSNLIPGHGGVLDRIDSIIFILLALYLIMPFIGG